MKRVTLVRYHPLFGSPVWLAPITAQRIYEREDALYLRMIEAGMRPSAPRIER